MVGRGFVLFDCGADNESLRHFSGAAAVRGVPLAVVRIDNEEIRALYQRKLVLVRPDGHVAWRDNQAPADVNALLDVVRGARVPEVVDG